MSPIPQPLPSSPDPESNALRLELDRVAHGDEQAFGRLYDATTAWVNGLALRIIGDADLAEEVMIDVFRQVWMRAATFDPARGSVSTWLLTMTRSRAIDRMRTKAVAARHESSMDDHPNALASIDPSPCPSVRASLRDRSATIRDALAQLPAAQREAIDLAFFQGLSHGKIAERLDRPLGTIKTRIRAGIRQLAELLQPLEDRE